MTALLAQLRLELALLARNGESLLLTLGIPALLLVFFANVDVLPIDGEPIDFLAPGVLSLAILSTALVNLAIGTAFEREYGVLKRLGATPLGRPRLLAGKTLAILVVEVVQIAVLWALAVALGWDPAPEPAFVLAVVLGTAAFAGLGLCLAGTLKALVALAAANGLYLVLLLLSGMVIPLDELPPPARAVAPRPAERGPHGGGAGHPDRGGRGARSRLGGAHRLGHRRPAPGHPPLPLGVRL